MRFLADENIPRVVIERLRAEGHDTISVGETTPSMPDDEILNVAEADGRILITGDGDFGEMVVRQRLKLRGVLLLELDRLPNAVRADTVAQIVSAHGERLAGNLVVIEPSRVRIRPLRP